MDHSDQASGGRRSSSELCLVLVGNIGCGKTLTADSLLGQRSAPGPSASSRVSQIRRGLAAGRRLTVVETPRWYWRGKKLEPSIQEETLRFLSTSLSGPFVFLILIPIGEFTEVEQLIPDQLERMFGRVVLGHTLVLLTCGEYLMGRSLQEYLRREEGLQEVVRRCGGRCHVISNRKSDTQQVITLLEKVEQMIRTDGGFELLRDEETDSETKLSAERDVTWSRETQAQSNSFDQHSDAVESQRVNGLQTQRWDREDKHGPHSPLDRSPSFKLTREGAILSQMMEEPEVQSSFTNTIHHSIQRLSGDSESVCPASPVHFSSSPPCRADVPELRMVLLGRRGSGKSTAGNLILGRGAFGRDAVPAEAEGCVRAGALLRDTQVTVVDTPDWFESERSPEEVRAQISSCVSLLAPGPHAFLLCIPVDRPAHCGLLVALEGVFGAAAVRHHTLVVFTHSDLLSGGAAVEDVEAYIASHRPEMLELVQRCGDRYHILRSSAGTELLEKVQQTVKESGGGFYSCPPLQQENTSVRRDRQNPSRLLDALREEEEEELLKSDRPDSTAPAPSVLRSAWLTFSSGARRVPMPLWAGALAGAALGVFLMGATGGAVGAVLGALLTEVSRRRFNKQKTQ